VRVNLLLCRLPISVLIGSCLSCSYILDKFFQLFRFSCNLLLYSLLGCLLTRVESRGLLQFLYYRTKSCWTKHIELFIKCACFEGLTHGRPLESQLLTPRTNPAYYQNSLNKLMALCSVILINFHPRQKFK